MLIDPLAQAGISDKENCLADMLQVVFLVGGLVFQIAPLTASSLPPDPPGHPLLLDQKKDLSPPGRELAHELKKQVIFTDRQVFHRVIPRRGDRKSVV